jgi:hypothetical protein
MPKHAEVTRTGAASRSYGRVLESALGGDSDGKVHMFGHGPRPTATVTHVGAKYLARRITFVKNVMKRKPKNLRRQNPVSVLDRK